jgi:hypothetical protein
MGLPGERLWEYRTFIEGELHSRTIASEPQVHIVAKELHGARPALSKENIVKVAAQNLGDLK